MRARSDGKQSASMHIDEITKRKLVADFTPKSVASIDAQMPFPVFRWSAEADEVIFYVARRAVFGPEAFAIIDEAALPNQITRVLEADRIQLNLIGAHEFRRTAERDDRDYQTC